MQQKVVYVRISEDRNAVEKVEKQLAPSGWSLTNAEPTYGSDGKYEGVRLYFHRGEGIIPRLFTT